MKNLSSKLFEKSFDLKKSNIYGGKAVGPTYIECSTNTTTSNCTDVRTTTQNDAGEVLSSCTSYSC